MVQVDETTQGVLNQISEGFEQKGAYNLRQNGIPLCHGDSEHIKIRKKEDKPGIDILIDGETKGEKVFIPVVVSVSGMTDLVYNDFYVADGADVTIVAGCGIHNGGCNDSRHDGIHTFHVGKNANVRYEEKHYGEGNGTGQRILNPVTNIEIGENSVFTLDTVQIKGVDSTIRTTNVVMSERAIPPRSSIRRQSAKTNATPISSAILSSWITPRSDLFRRSRQSMWMRQSSTRRRSDGSMMSSC